MQMKPNDQTVKDLFSNHLNVPGSEIKKNVYSYDRKEWLVAVSNHHSELCWFRPIPGSNIYHSLQSLDHRAFGTAFDFRVQVV
jgi:hypothetical protein